MPSMTLLVFALLTSQVAPDPVDVARGLKDAGKRDEAIRVLQEAFAQERKPEYLFWLSQHQQAAGQWVDAEQSLRGALAFQRPDWKRKPKAKEKPDYDKATLALPLIQARLGTLTVVTEPADGVEITLDGVVVGTSPIPARRVVAGTVVVGVRREGFLPIQRPVVVSPGSNARELLKLIAKEPEPVPSPVAVAPPAAEPAATQPMPVTPTPPPAPPPVMASDGPPAGFWVLGAVGLVGGAVGGTLLVLGEDDAQKTVVLGCSGRPVDDAQCVDLNNSSSAKRSAGIIALAAGGAALLGAGLVWLLSDGDAAQTTWVAPSLTEPGVAFGGRF